MTSDAGESKVETRVQKAVVSRSMARLDLGNRLDAGKILRSYRRAAARWCSKTMSV
jgi:hypothetical protein